MHGMARERFCQTFLPTAKSLRDERTPSPLRESDACSLREAVNRLRQTVRPRGFLNVVCAAPPLAA